MDRKRRLELRKALLARQSKSSGPIKVTAGDKTTTTPKARYDMEASDVIRSPLEQAQAIGPDAVQRLSDARALSDAETFGKSFGNRLDKFGAGAQEVYNEVGKFSSAMDDMILPEPVFDILNRATGDQNRYKTYVERNKTLAEEQSAVDVQNKQFEQVKGVPGFLGDVAAYAIPEVLTGPLSAKGAGLAMDAVSSGLRATGREVAKESSAVTKWLAKQNPQALKDVAKFGEEKIGEPVKELVQRYVGRRSVGNPNRRGMAKDIAAGIGTGATTGMLDYDLSIGEGALSGLAGGISGAGLTKPLSRRYDANTQAGRDVIDFMKKKQYRVDPGVDIRNTAMYNKTRKYRSDDTTSEMMQTYSDNNQKVVNDITYKTMGFSDSQIANMTPKTFKEGIDVAGKEFDDLVSGTKGFIPKKAYADMNANLDSLIKNPASSSTTTKEAKEVLEYLEANTNVTRDPGTGRFRKATFDGKTYQEMRSTMKEKIDKLYENGDTVTARELSPVLKYLDDSLEIGMKRGGEVNPAQWASARERWAMGEILKTKGINSADMDVDPHALFKAFKRDPRMMTGANGPVSDLMSVGKFSELEHKLNEKAGVLSGTHQSKKGHAMTLFEEAKAKRHMSGYPIRYGLANMKRYDGLYKPSTGSRPISQAGQIWPAAVEGVESVYDKLSDPNKSIEELLKWYNDRENNSESVI